MRACKKRQAAGKGLQIGLGVDELDYSVEDLKPEGLWLDVGGIGGRNHAPDDRTLAPVRAWACH
jgi:hypothetical protein